MSFSAVLFSLAVLLQAAAPPVPPPVHLSPQDTNAWDHRLGAEQMLHRTPSEFEEAMKKPLGYSQHTVHCTFMVVVSESGLVESAETRESCGDYTEAAAAIQAARRYKPWRVDGIAARVQVEDAVHVVPPERWGPHADLPDPVDVRTVEMTLQRTPCYGSCPAYTVTVAGNGSVRFEGGWNVALPGHHSAQIGRAAALNLLQQFRKADFFSALPVYRHNVTDYPTYTLTLSINGKTAQVVDYAGLDEGLPLQIEQLEHAMDEAAGTEAWVRGEGDRLGTLKREHWDFASGSSENAALYRTAVERGDATLTAELLRAHAPVNVDDSHHFPVVCAASEKGELSLVVAMLANKPALSPAQQNRCLTAAAQSGNLDLVKVWLERGADPNGAAPFSKDAAGNEAPLRVAARRGNAAVVDLLLNHGADAKAAPGSNEEPLIMLVAESHHSVDRVEIGRALMRAGTDVAASDFRGRNALFQLNEDAAFLAFLLQAGLQIDSRDEYGETPLMFQAFRPKTVTMLLDAGADPTLRSKRGEDAAQTARRFGSEESVKLLTAALRKRGMVPAVSPE